ncbi:hypothetical protein POM88_050661 [Heracleum sosnowskyi]|uniref:Transposase MuDR plant domain-containing protein n=1 Tax=Heracleum sosnowskyi TaxID=360622 RepID=A0AAD8M0L8_9APIA|nr:hypothetical protein POM88_050661 [Heracleum sosnowskyi]
MSTRVAIHLCHHGDFSSDSVKGNVKYVGGIVDVIDVDTDRMSFLDLEDYAKTYKYSNLFVDHKKKFKTIDQPPTSYKFLDKEGKDDEVGGSVVDNREGELFGDDTEDSDYNYDKKIGCDEEFFNEESEYNRDELRSKDSSSEDENLKQGYVGVPPGQKRKKQRVLDAYNDEVVKWDVGMKFASMEEFRKVVRAYSIRERRALHFIKNEKSRCQVGCESGCSFYLWCSKLPNEEAMQVKTCLDHDHQCTKPYHNTLISVKYLTELYGDRIRINPLHHIT